MFQGSVSWSGVIYGVGASAFVALNAIYTRKKISVVDGDVWKLCFYNNVNTCVIFIPIIHLTGEWKELNQFQNFFNIQFWFFMLIGGIFGFAIGYVTGLQIKVTSPLSHTVSGTAKACIQTIIAYLVFSEIKSVFWWLSNVIVMGGSLCYAIIRKREMDLNNYKMPQ